MNEQGSLFDESAPYQRHSETSKAAAEAIEPKKHVLQGKVLAYLRSRASGATDEEIATDLHLNPSGARPRRIELVAKGLVRDSGRTRKTRSGKSAVVWEAV